MLSTNAVANATPEDWTDSLILADDEAPAEAGRLWQDDPGGELDPNTRVGDPRVGVPVFGRGPLAWRVADAPLADAPDEPAVTPMKAAN